jgi:tagatose 1,6-diphosphate aldolase
MELSAGKFWGMRRLADAGGRFKMLAADQRAPLFGPIAAKRGTAQAPYDDVVAVKQALVKGLAPQASAVLLDPLYGYARPIADVPPGCGLILAYEHSVVEETPGGRKTRAIPDWSVAKIKRLGADAVKVLVWYRADAAPEVRRHQQDFVAAAGAACAAHDIVCLLEILIYPLPGESPDESRRSERVLAAIADFADPRFGVDIYKLEAPVALHAVPDPEGREAAAVQKQYDAMARLIARPWVMLSAGTSADDFARHLVYAYRAGASGYLAGRAIWAEAFAAFPDMAQMAAKLEGAARAYMERINALTDAQGARWTDHPGWGGTVTLAGAGPDFVRAYAG